jgi:chorismate lyase / 3-hydroxybenzoate synthase
MSGAQSLRLEYVAPSESRSDGWQDVLGAAAFDGGAAAPHGSGSDFPLARVHTSVLGGAREVLEVWRAGGRARSESHGRVRYASSGELLFGSLSVHEGELRDGERAAADGRGNGSRPTRTPLALATELAYREMYATLSAAGDPGLVRVWNYIPQINLETEGLERYRQFNTARHDATLACGRAVTGAVPAASALGAAPGSPLTIYFLASHRAPAFIENPRQVSAYRYPAEYGPRSPSFSRATVLGEGEEATLFISGTASIVGHRTMHAGDPAAQTREALVNIEALLEEAGRRSSVRALRLESLAYKIYVREPRELPLIRAELEAAVGTGTTFLYLQADICRRELAVEIEAVGGHGWRGGPSGSAGQ